MDGVWGLDLSQEEEYGREYFKKYREYSKTVRSELLTKLRFLFVRSALNSIWSDGVAIRFGQDIRVCDIGPGSHEFMNYVNTVPNWRCDARDVGYGQEVLYKVFRQETQPLSQYQVLTMWDSFEHLSDPRGAIGDFIPELICMSLPIYRDKEEVLRSKHFRPTEHRWYHTEFGIQEHMLSLGYSPLYSKGFEIEQLVGREGIMTFAFIPEKKLKKIDPEWAMRRECDFY